MHEYKYGVAFSFLAQDELLATGIAEILKERHRVFLYSREQEQLAGTDGEKSFNEVFSEQARVVVVLYRHGWGESSRTRIEETAIRNCVRDKGCDVALFVPTDDKPTVPKYVPKTRLWIGLARFGINGAASVVDARIQELGGELRVLTLEECAARAQQAADFKKFRKGYFNSHERIQAADASFGNIVQATEQRVEALHAAAPGLDLQAKRFGQILVVLGTGPALRLEWCSQCANSFDGAYLDATIWDGHPPVPGFTYRKERRPRHTLRPTPDVTEGRTFAWSFKIPEGGRLLGADEAAEFILSWWLDKTEGAVG